jgi:glycosyltransferase involved in cell wall biosynthesis
MADAMHGLACAHGRGLHRNIARPRVRIVVIVVHVMPSLARTYGGPVAALAGYIAAGRVAGVNSVVVGPRPDADDTAWLRETVPGTTLILTGRAGAGPWVAAPALLRGLTRQLADAEIVHVHGLLNPVSSGAARVALRHRVPVVIGPFGTMSRYTFAHRRTAAKRLYFRLIDAPNLRRAAAIHFTTDAERDEARWHGIEFEARAHVVPPPYRATAVPTGTRSRDAAAASVLFLGRLHPVKGVDLLLDAWPAIRAGHPTARLIIAGVGALRYEAELRARAAGLGLHAGSVTFAGFVRGAGKASCLASAGVCVLPSRHENFGISVLDAVAAGVPIVVTPGVQLAPWIEAHAMGLVADRSASAVADAVGRALNDADLRSRVERCGAAAVEADFAPQAVAPALRAMYDAAAATRRAGFGRSPE